MDAIEKMERIKACGGETAYIDVAIRCYSPLDRPWYCSVQGIDIKRGYILEDLKGDGYTPEEAVDSMWYKATMNLLIVNAFGDNRKIIRWNPHLRQFDEVKENDYSNT